MTIPCAPHESIPTGTTFTLREAARLIDRSRETVKNDLDAGAYPGAFKSPGGHWLVPVGDLVAAGRLAPDRVVEATALPARETLEVRELREQLIALRTQLDAHARLVGTLESDKAFLQSQLSRMTGRR